MLLFYKQAVSSVPSIQKHFLTLGLNVVRLVLVLVFAIGLSGVDYTVSGWLNVIFFNLQ